MSDWIHDTIQRQLERHCGELISRPMTAATIRAAEAAVRAAVLSLAAEHDIYASDERGAIPPEQIALDIRIVPSRGSASYRVRRRDPMW